ncbi:hypothetical protein AUEXF2481DRAFT_150968 [Aureobasidium subglaciale EXF-2481]|uniref:Uncharacterized protein n=1 Tax=Aureobasidium subglaciale (strain EXF-2481) TaxID=1043005 RepID=A0A074YSL0_AURSE|nr:uncharacterized protein AUEXF2481DRAFT_150968 [Aureobasidium subglaciale EXF-2481]KER00661.1 hypothetical protein AUEXF2481DRAFT_150968 [Aureobasidium subglaciale EXF-2481]
MGKSIRLVFFFPSCTFIPLFDFFALYSFKFLSFFSNPRYSSLHTILKKRKIVLSGTYPIMFAKEGRGKKETVQRLVDIVSIV